MSKNLINTLLLVASFTLYYIVIKPLYTGVGSVWQPEQSIETLSVLNGEYDDTLTQADSLFQQAQSLRGQYERISPEDKARMEVMVPDSIDKVHLLSEVHGIGEDAGFALSDLIYSEEPNTATGKGTVGISFTVKTTYPRFKVLMNNFEKSLRLFSVESVTFSNPNKDGDLTSFQVKLQTYYLK